MTAVLARDTCDFDSGMGAPHGAPAAWVHVVHYDRPWADVPEDGHGHRLPDHMVSVRRYCHTHASVTAVEDTTDPTVVGVAYARLA